MSQDDMTNSEESDMKPENGAGATGGSESMDSSDESSTPRERRPRVFGKYAPFIVLVPFVVYMSGLMLAGWIKNVSVRIAAEHEKGPLRTAVAVAKAYALDGRFEDAEWRGDIDWVRLEELVQDEHGRVDDFEDVMRPLDSGKEGLDASEFENLRNTWTEFKPIIAAMGAGTWKPAQKQRSYYPKTYAIVIGVTAVFTLIAFPGYFKAPFRISWLSFAVGAVGVVVWIGLWWLNQEVLHLAASGTREAFNPFEALKDDPTWMYQFLAIRFAGLVLIVPLIEEFFLRGWLMRYIDDPDWDEIPLGEAGKMAIWGATIYGVVAHMGEPLAAAAWFSMVTWLYLRTKSVWDCVVAHAVTNLLLGLYVIKTGTWELW